jgi:hypothetical protein
MRKILSIIDEAAARGTDVFGLAARIGAAVEADDVRAVVTAAHGIGIEVDVGDEASMADALGAIALSMDRAYASRMLVAVADAGYSVDVSSDPDIEEIVAALLSGRAWRS